MKKEIQLLLVSEYSETTEQNCQSNKCSASEARFEIDVTTEADFFNCLKNYYFLHSPINIACV